MNTLELAKTIGQVGLLLGRRNEFATTVRITDAKHVYGCVRYLVTPINGQGSVWVDSSRVQLQGYIAVERKI